MRLPALPFLNKLQDLPRPMVKFLVGSAIAWATVLSGMVAMAIAFRHSSAEKEAGLALRAGEAGSLDESGLQEPAGIEGEMGAEESAGGHGKVVNPIVDAYSSPAGLGHEVAGGTNAAHSRAKEWNGHSGSGGEPSHESSPSSQESTDESEASDAGHSDLGHETNHPSKKHATPTANRDEGELLRQLVTELAQNGQVTKAFPFLQRALAHGETPPEFLTIAARLMMANGHYAEAQDLAERALYELPGRQDMGVLAMMAAYRQGKVEEAMLKAMELLQQQPKNVELLTALGTMHSEQHPEDPTADGFLSEALRVDPQYIPALYQVGRRQMHATHYAKAQKTFEGILKLQPGYSKALAQLGMALYYQEKFEASRQNLISALQVRPRDYNTWYNLGEVYRQQAAEAGPAHPDIVKALQERAFSSYNQAIELNPRHGMAHYRLGLLLMGNNQDKEASRHFEFALEILPDYVPAWLQLSLAYENLRLYDKARAALDKAYALDPLNKVVALKLREWG